MGRQVGGEWRVKRMEGGRIEVGPAEMVKQMEEDVE
jgi:hypothetical protein